MKNKISLKLIFLIFIISFTITSISSYIQIANQYENRINFFEKNLNNIKKSSIPILTQSLWELDDISTNIIVTNLLDNQNIIYTKLIKDDGKSFSVGSIKDKNILTKEFQITKKFDSKTLKLGRLIIVADLSPVYKELKNNAYGIIITEIITMLLISLSIIFVMKKLLTNQIEIISDYANKLSLKKLDKPLKIIKQKDENDELTVLVDSINNMRENILLQIQEKDEQNRIMTQQSKMATMGEMLSNIVHQWKQPISVISMSNGLIRMKNESEEDFITQENLNNAIDKIDLSIENLIQTIEDFRGFFDPNKEKILFPIEKAIEMTFKLISSQFKNHNIEIIQEHQYCEYFGSQNELQQVLINLLKNAKEELIKKDSSEKRLLFIKSYQNDENIIIKIRDNAGGIPINIKDKIFDSYFTTKEKDGTGIGLYMSKQIIRESMKGILTADNVEFIYEDEKCKGAEFTISLPNVK